jgi:hypothetical protein
MLCLCLAGLFIHLLGFAAAVNADSDRQEVEESVCKE